MNYPYQIEHFVKGYLESVGGLCERPAWGVIEAIFDDPGKRLGDGHLVLAFDYDVALEYPGSQFISYGSATYEKIVAMAVSDHCCARRYVRPGERAPAGLEAKIAAKLLCAAGHIQISQLKLYLAKIYRFQFKVAFLGDQREEIIRQIWIDTTSGAEIAQYGALSCIFFDEKPAVLLPELPTRKPLEILSAAVASLDASTKSHKAALESKLADQKEKEMERTQSYFTSLIDGYRQATARAQAQNDDKTIKETQARLAGMEAQRRHHLHDIAAKYSVKSEATLLDLVCYLVPRWRVRAQDKRANTSQPELEWWWDEPIKSFV